MDPIYRAIDADSQPLAQARQLHDGSRALSSQRREAEETLKEARRQTRTLDGACERATEALKHVGDLRNWQELVDEQLRVMELAVAARQAQPPRSRASRAS